MIYLNHKYIVNADITAWIKNTENKINYLRQLIREYIQRSMREGEYKMPTICMFRGIKIFINWREHQPPHFHATYGGQEVIVSIKDLEVIEGEIPGKQLKMLLGWAAFHQDELMENWELAENKQELFSIEPLR